MPNHTSSVYTNLHCDIHWGGSSKRLSLSKVGLYKVSTLHARKKNGLALLAFVYLESEDVRTGFF